jgi:hypothetical protein
MLSVSEVILTSPIITMEMLKYLNVSTNVEGYVEGGNLFQKKQRGVTARAKASNQGC